MSADQIPEKVRRMIEKKEYRRRQASRYARLINTAMRKVRQQEGGEK